jgi:glycosyltransferase involved in cell wall biosynthesis
MARVSIITRTFDRPVLLARMFRSLAEQTFTDWQCIVVNGGSESTVHQAMVGLDVSSRTQIVPFTGKPGMRGATLNQGVQASETELVTVLDDDDTWHPEFLQRMVHLLDQYPATGAAGVVCRSEVIKESSVEDGLIESAEAAEKGREIIDADLRQATLARLAIENCWCIHAFLYKRSAYDAVGGYSEALPVLEDWEFNLRFLCQNDVMVLPQVLARYHLRPGISSGQQANSQFGELDLHKFYDAKIRNDALRADWAAGRNGLGQLLAHAAQTHWLERHVHRVEGRVRAASEKIGKIDARTKEMKKGK